MITGHRSRRIAIGYARQAKDLIVETPLGQIHICTRLVRDDGTEVERVLINPDAGVIWEPENGWLLRKPKAAEEGK